MLRGQMGHLARTHLPLTLTRTRHLLLFKNTFLSTVPSQPPQNVTVAKDNSTSTSLFIHWRPVPTNHQNGIILGYRILYKKSSGLDELKFRNVSARSTTAELKNLTKYTEYDVTILAYTSKGNGVRAKFFTVSTTEDRKYTFSRHASTYVFHCNPSIFSSCAKLA